LGAVPSPILIARVRQNTGAYGPAIYTIAIAMVCALVLPILAHFRPNAPTDVTVIKPDERLPRAA
jgi:hypothetical protein